MKKPSINSIITAEYRLLNALIKKPEYRDDSRVDESLLQDELAKSLYESIFQLHSNNIEITPASLYQAGTSIDFNVTKTVVDAVFNIDEDGASNLDDIIFTLKETKKKNELLSKIEKIKLDLQSPGNINKEELLENVYNIEDQLSKEEIESPIIDFDQWADIYEDELDLRSKGKIYSYGDTFLDKFLYKGATPKSITTLAATTGAGKSLFTLNLINNLINQNEPCIYISLEMGDVDTFDRLLSLRAGIPSEELYKPENVEAIREAVKNQREELKERKNFYFCQDPDIDMTKLRSIIREYKHKTKNDYVFVAIDLLTMMKEFSNSKGNTAQSIEVAMNELSSLAKTENVHIFGVVQFNRQTDNIKIHTIEEINELRPALNNIKNSGAIAERSRVVLGLFNPKQYVDKYLVPINAPGCDDVENTLELQILKNSHGGVGKVFRYMLIPEQFKAIPIEDEEEAKLDSLSQQFDF